MDLSAPAARQPDFSTENCGKAAGRVGRLPIKHAFNACQWQGSKNKPFGQGRRACACRSRGFAARGRGGAPAKRRGVRKDGLPQVTGREHWGRVD